MTVKDLMQKTGATPGKLALVAVLAVVLGVVIVGQLPESTVAPTLARAQPALPSAVSQRHSSPKPAAASEPHNDGTQQSSSDSQTQGDNVNTWPTLPFEKVMSYDPLATPDWLAAAQGQSSSAEDEARLLAESRSRARKAEVLQLLREEGTKMVVITAGDKRAIIGEQTVRVGDQIEGFQITDITKQGVVLTEIEQH